MGYSPTGKLFQSPPSSDKKTGKAPLNSFLFISPASPGDRRTLGQARANWRSMAAAAVSTIGRPKHACGPKPWWRYVSYGRSSLMESGFGNLEGSRPAVIKSTKTPAPGESGLGADGTVTGFGDATTRRTPEAAGNNRKLQFKMSGLIRFDRDFDRRVLMRSYPSSAYCFNCSNAFGSSD